MKNLFNPADILLDKVVRKGAGWGVKPAASLGLSPNQITFGAFMLFILPAAFFFAQGTYFFNILGLVFIFIHTYFDHLDGMLARFTGKSSAVGEWLDSHLDIISTNLLIAAVGFAILKTHPSLFWFAVVIGALFAQAGIYAVVWEYHNTIYTSFEFLNGFRRNKKTTILDKIIKDFITLENPLFLFLGTLRYVFLLAIIFNQLKYFLLMVAIFYNLRWIVMFWAYVCVFDRKPKWQVIKILSEFIIKKSK